MTEHDKLIDALIASARYQGDLMWGDKYVAARQAIDEAFRKLREENAEVGRKWAERGELLLELGSGFTWEDVKLLRHAAEHAKPAHPELSELADRIARTLPTVMAKTTYGGIP